MTEPVPTQSQSAMLFSRSTLFLVALMVCGMTVAITWLLASGDVPPTGLLVVALVTLLGVLTLGSLIRNRFRWGMRTLLVAMSMVAVVLGGVGTRWVRARSQHRAVVQLKALETRSVGAVTSQLGRGVPVVFTASVSIDYVRGNDIGSGYVSTARGYTIPNWLVQVVGEDFFFTTHRVSLQCIDLSDPTVLRSIDLSHFRNLNLSFCRLGRETVHVLAALDHLQELTLIDCELLGDDFTPLAKLQRLESLTLCQMAVDREDLAGLASLTSLKHLSLQENGLAPGDLTALVPLQGLRSLNLAGNPLLSAQDMGVLRQLPSLTGINLTGTGVDEEFLPTLRTLPQLEWISITASSPEVVERLNREEAERDERLTVYVE